MPKKKGDRDRGNPGSRGKPAGGGAAPREMFSPRKDTQAGRVVALFDNSGSAAQGRREHVKPLVVLDAQSTASKDVSGYIQVATIAAEAVIGAAILAFLKYSMARENDDATSVHIYEYVQQMFAIAGVVTAFVGIVMQGLVPAVLTWSTGPGRKAFEEDGSPVPVKARKTGRIWRGALIAMVAFGANEFISSRPGPYFPLGITQNMSAELQAAFPLPGGYPEGVVVNGRGYRGPKYPDPVVDKLQLTIRDLYAANATTLAFQEALAADFSQPLASVGKPEYQRLLDAANKSPALNVTNMGDARIRGLLRVDEVQWGAATNLSWTRRNCSLCVRADALDIKGSYSVLEAFVYVTPSGLKPEVPPGAGFAEAAADLGGRGLRWSGFDGVAELFENEADVTRANRIPFSASAMTPINSARLEADLGQIPAVNWAGGESLIQIVGGQVFPYSNTAMTQLQLLAATETNRINSERRSAYGTKIAELKAADELIRRILRPAITARETAQANFDMMLMVGRAGAFIGSMGGATTLLVAAERAFWPSAKFKPEALSVWCPAERGGSEKQIDGVVAILVDAWNFATSPRKGDDDRAGRGIGFLKPGDYEIFGQFSGTAASAGALEAQNSLRKVRIRDAYLAITRQTGAEQLDLIRAVLSGNSELDMGQGFFWLRLALYQRVRDGYTDYRYPLVVIDSLFEVIKIGLPQRVHSRDHPTRCLWASEENGNVCTSEDDTQKDNTGLLCGDLGGPNKFVACLEQPSNSNAAYDALHAELTQGASACFLCMNCVRGCLTTFEVTPERVLELADPGTPIDAMNALRLRIAQEIAEKAERHQTTIDQARNKIRKEADQKQRVSRNAHAQRLATAQTRGAFVANPEVGGDGLAYLVRTPEDDGEGGAEVGGEEGGDY